MEAQHPNLRLAVFADTHRNIDPVVEIVRGLPPDYLIYHLGDYRADAARIEQLTGRRMTKVAGNNDYPRSGEDTVIEQLAEGVTLMATHGHRFGVKLDIEQLAVSAKHAGATIVVYGHTHVPAIDTIDGVMLVCPGAFHASAYMSYAEIIIGETIEPRIIRVDYEDAAVR